LKIACWKNLKISEIIGKKEIKMNLNLIVKAKKDGKMNDGRYFCYRNDNYYATILDGDEEDDGDFYYVEDVMDELSELHGMDKDFFDEYFEIIERFGDALIK